MYGHARFEESVSSFVEEEIIIDEALKKIVVCEFPLLREAE